MNPRVFSLEEANRLVPHLDELTARLLQKKTEMQKKHDQILILDLIAGEKAKDHESADGKEYISKSAELEALILSFEDDILEINRLGCYLRDINKGSIDFFSIRNHQLVYLNWLRGEPEIRHYHDVDSHFTKRKALDP